MKKLGILLLLVANFMYAQEEDKEQAKRLKASKNFTWEANKALSENDFVNAEADYRKAISKSADNAAAPYNLGNAYYAKETFGEAFSRFKQAGELATTKEAKHKAYHNMGNVFMKEKQYEKAVEAYKQALRNDPTDEETRYNLALAQEMLKKQQDEDQQNQDQDDKEQDNKEDKKDEKEDPKDGDNKDDQQQDDQKEDGDKGDQEDPKEKEGEGEQKEDKKPKEGDQPEDKKEPQQPRPSQLSPQQVQNLLEAMQNEEKKVQEKMDAKKVKGVKTKNEKDW